jgi:hypothetical protein
LLKALLYAQYQLQWQTLPVGQQSGHELLVAASRVKEPSRHCKPD